MGSLLAGPQEGDPTTVTPPHAPGSGGEAARPADLCVPRSGYRILRAHDQGGLGEVLVARDEALGRDVALKRIQLRRLHDADSRRRFLLEAEITGQLEHPGVVPVYSLMQDPVGQPCYAMRFIAGENLRDAIKSFHAAEQPGRDPGERHLAWRQLLSRFVTVCNTMAYAHSRGILHRDLKPANIMLGPYGETLVVDWGLAKKVGDAQPAGADAPPEGSPLPFAPAHALTATGRAIGTAAYMSPEQAAGRWEDVGPASDIYSLGATLYTLLTNQLAFQGRDIVDKVKRGDFLPPRRWKGDIPPALEVICLKAMALNPADRYASASALADDVEHWLADEPVAAYREPWRVRLGRWARRHKPLVAGTTALLVAAVLSLTIIVVLSEQARRKLVAEQARTDAQWQRAEANFQLANEAVGKYLDEVTEDPDLTKGDFGKLRQRLLETAVPFYEKLVEQKSEDPALEATRGRAWGRLATLRAGMGQWKKALADSEEMRAIFARLAADFPAVPEYRHHLTVSRNDRGLALAGLGRREEAEAAFHQARTNQEQLVADFPTAPAYQELARGYYNLGLLLARDLGRRAEPEAAHRRARAIRAKLATDFPAVPQYRRELAASYNSLGTLLRSQQGRRTEAEVAFHEALTLKEQLVAAFPDIPAYRQELAQSYNNFGNLLQENPAQRGKAKAHYERARVIRTELAVAFPNNPAYRRDLAATHNNLGALLKELEGPEAAAAAYRQALAIREQLAAAFPDVPDYRRDLAESHNNLAVLFRELRQWEKAEAHYHQALTNLEQLVTAFPTVTTYAFELGAGYGNLGRLTRDQGPPAAALEWFDKAVRTLALVLAQEPSHIRARSSLHRAYWARAAILDGLGRHAEAVKDWDQTIALDDGTLRPSFRALRALSLAHAGEHVQAVAAVSELARVKKLSSNTLYYCACVYAIASAAVQNDPPLAEQYARRAVELLKRAVATGFKDVKRLKEDKDLAPLRGRADFAQLLAEI
jgi:serine/threonine-protein kinase